MKKVSQMQLVKKNKQEGAGLIEYAVIAALVVAIAVIVFPLLSTAVQGAFSRVITALGG